MKRNLFSILTLVLLAIPCGVHAQFFDFGFGRDPFSQREQRQREKVEAPQFKGGEEALRKYLLKHYENPPVESRDVEGRVVVACIIDEKGRVVETHVVRSVGTDFDKEARRVCSKMKFQPARQGKKKVKSRFDITFPIRHSRLSFLTLPTVDI